MYYVYSKIDDVYITTDDGIETEDKLEGSFDTFTHAKDFAWQVISVSVANARSKYETAKLNKARFSSITKKKVDND